MDVIWDQITSNLLVYNLQLPYKYDGHHGRDGHLAKLVIMVERDGHLVKKVIIVEMVIMVAMAIMVVMVVMA